MLIGAITLLVVTSFYGSLSWGLVVWKFWYWFLLPVFPTLPAITFIQGVGIMLVVSLFRGHPAQIIKDEYVNKSTGIIITAIMPWLALFLGWLIKVILF